MDEGIHGGTRRCSLSITENLIIPYSGRMKGRRPQHTVQPMIVYEAESDAEEEMEEQVDEERKEYYDNIYASVGWDATASQMKSGLETAIWFCEAT